MDEKNEVVDLEQQVDVQEPTQTQEQEPTVRQEDVEAKPTAPTTEKLKSFTRDQVNKIMRARLERDRNSFLRRYGVKDREGLDSLIGQAQSYQVMKERYEQGKARIGQLEESLAFMSNGINKEREDDIRAYFKGKGLEFNNDALVKELETHPEWRKVVESDNTPKTTIEVLGVEHRDRNVPETESEKQKRIFGI